MSLLVKQRRKMGMLDHDAAIRILIDQNTVFPQDAVINILAEY